MTSFTTPNPKRDGVQDLRTKLVVYMSFYVEARDAQDAQEMAKWVDKLERLISDTVKSEVGKALNEVERKLVHIDEHICRFNDGEQTCDCYKESDDINRAAIEKVMRRWK